ncbi:unnamed protein product [Calypogeia fissa]
MMGLERQLGPAVAMTGGGWTCALREISLLLAGNAGMASEKLVMVLGQAPVAAGSVQHDGSTPARLNARQLYSMLAVAQFLAHSVGGELRRDLWNVVVEFLRVIPEFCVDEFRQFAISFAHASSFFSDLMLAVVKIAEMHPAASEELSNLIATVVPRVITLSNSGKDNNSPFAPGIKYFLMALAQSCPPLRASDAESVTKCLLEHWFLNFQRGVPAESSDGTSDHGSPVLVSRNDGVNRNSLSNGYSPSHKEVNEQLSVSPSNDQINVTGLIARFEASPQAEGSLPYSTTSTTPIFTPSSTPSRLIEGEVTPSRSGMQNGTKISPARSSSVDHFYAPQTEGPHDREFVGQHFVRSLEEESLPMLERQELAFRLSTQIFERSGASRQLSDAHVKQLRTAAVIMLRSVLPLLKMKKQDWPTDGGEVRLEASSLKAKLDLKLQACQEATALQTKCLVLSESDANFRVSLRDSLPLSLDVADLCIVSPWRKMKSCELLFGSLLRSVVQVAAILGGQILRSVLLRLKSIALAACAQAEVWKTAGQACPYESIVTSSCILLEAAWKSDKSSVESFLTSLAAHIHERVEQGEQERHVVFVQTNIVSFLADMAKKLSKWEIVEIMLPQFIESFEQRDISVPNLLRLKLMEALARLGSLGSEKSYREVVVLLTREYLDVVSSDRSVYSGGSSSDSLSEHLDTLTNALLQLARGLRQPKLRSDLRERLLTLCSNVGLVAEAKNRRTGAKFFGPLLPAVAEISSDFDPTQDVEPSMLKLFRNLWFYVALFGLAPAVQNGLSQSNQSSSFSGNANSSSSGNVVLQAVRGAYLWNLEWSAAVTEITKGTPPLVVSALKWLEDEVELKALHNPGSRREIANDKVVLTQRTAFSVAIGGVIEISALSSISGVKATYLLGVALLEILRLGRCGGVLGNRSLTGGFTSALSCAFKYLETPDLPPVVQQCFAAIVHQAFNATLSWLGEKLLFNEEQAEEKEEILIAHTSFLIGAMSHREENVRHMADSLLTQFRKRFPQILWNPRCLDEVLGLVVNVAQPATGTQSGEIVSLRVFSNERVRDWIRHALLLAPCTVQGLLQEQFRKLNTWEKASQTSDLLSLLSDVHLDSTRTDGWSGNINIPAVLAAAAAAAGTGPVSAKGGSMDVLSTGIISANVKSNCAGEIAGMKTFFAGMDGLTASPGTPTKHALGTVNSFGNNVHEKTKAPSQVLGEELTLHQMLTTRFVHLLQQFVVSAQRGSSVDPAAFREACLRAAALLLSYAGSEEKAISEGFDQLLRLLCWCPAHIFTPEVMETGIFVWTWLLSAAPHLGSRVLAELVDAWLWTIDAEKGIFAFGLKRSGPAAKLRPQLTPGEPRPVGDKELVQGIKAHYVWLGFLLDRYEVVRNVSNDQLFLISRLLQGSVKSATHFSCHPAATGAFFSLMLLGMKYCAFQSQVGSSVGTTGITLLEKRLYRAALGWFSVEPGWYDADVEGSLPAQARTMAIFVQHLVANHPPGNSLEQISLRTIHVGTSSRSINGQVGSAHPVWGRASDDYSENERRKLLLLMLCQCEADRLETWANPLNKELAPRAKVSADQWSEYAKTAWLVDPRIALSLVTRFPAIATLKTEVTSLVQGHLIELFDIPEALPYFVTPKAVEEDSPVLHYLSHWAPCAIADALEFLTPAYKGHHRVMAYVLRVMQTYPPESVTFFMPQLIQSLRYDQKGLVEGYLVSAAQRSNLFAHILIWQLQGEEAPSAEDVNKEHHHEVAKNNLYDVVPKVRQRIIDSFTPEAHTVFLHEFKFFDKVTSISGVLYPLPKDERRAGIRRELEKIKVETEDLYLPTAPNKLVRGIQLDSGIPLQSAAKVPIMITFDVIDKDGDPNNMKQQACIFKVGDDCRQDVLALQVIALLRDIYEAVGINLYLFPYGVLPTGYGRGIIEVVPNSRSRNQMADITDGGLLDNFQQDFGAIGSKTFEAARENFIVSSAGYAVASLLLQPKDRHNGNLLFDKDGRLVHIDFGFILETSPGGNLRFESAHFKLSHEMTQLLDPSGAMKSEPWYRFVSLSVKGYLTARQHMNGIINTVLLMKDSGLPCFSRGDPIGNLRKRFHPEMNEREAANFMIKTCEDAYNKWTTTGYDLIQYLQQGIEK